jgi:hypothetical protein
METLLVARVSGALSFAGAWGGIRVHLLYMRRDLDGVMRSARGAHWRLDQVDAPPAPLDH